MQRYIIVLSFSQCCPTSLFHLGYASCLHGLLIRYPPDTWSYFSGTFFGISKLWPSSNLRFNQTHILCTLKHEQSQCIRLYTTIFFLLSVIIIDIHCFYIIYNAHAMRPNSIIFNECLLGKYVTKLSWCRYHTVIL